MRVEKKEQRGSASREGVQEEKERVEKKRVERNASTEEKKCE